VCAQSWHVHVRTSWEEKNVKKEQITGWLSLFLLRSICRPLVCSLSLTLYASFCLLPFIAIVCQTHPTTVQTEKKKRKKNERVCARVRWTSFMLRACYTNSKEEVAAALAICITWKANKNNNNNNNRCVKNNISTVAHCARCRSRAKMSLFSFGFFLLSFLSLLSLLS